MIEPLRLVVSRSIRTTRACLNSDVSISSSFSVPRPRCLILLEPQMAQLDVAAPDVRANLPKISNWPTFPQVFINGELIGGCDITLDLYQKGELQKMLQDAASEATSS